jgi:hypothetical protein
VTTQVALGLEAMATRFELILAGDDPSRLRAAGEEALQEIRRVEAQLSRYRPAERDRLDQSRRWRRSPFAWTRACSRCSASAPT